MTYEIDETTAVGATPRINPADFLAALDRIGGVSGGEPPSAAIDSVAAALMAGWLVGALAVPASLRRFYDGAVKSVAAEEAGHGS